MSARTRGRPRTKAWPWYSMYQRTCRQNDRAILDAILANIMANSVEHTSLGGTITIRAEQVCARTMLTITNDCEGLTAEDLPHLFEPFSHKDAARTDGSHCGLGLTLVKDYCQSMEWDITAVSSSRFSLPDDR